ncbi:sulfotransferase [Rhodanobacter sp. AS-Z3]|uniref:tetratricopeptide repeat-containing sulfotransferase family protein n=1 Tax=Rhodanobacter sp. AS-Z3 TaxID=3031330 RepID=UPI00247A982D|nr:sulfotransferase [Rhodanobacter sp. AS-Z3]WEN15279.1 sulfotransferase [Rhodanobacter sp. AS-Z3]
MSAYARELPQETTPDLRHFFYYAFSFVREPVIMSGNSATPNPQGRAADLPPAVVQLLAAARGALASGLLEHAEQQLTELVTLMPECTEAHRLLGIAALMGNQPARAIDHLQRAVASRPGDPTLNMNLGSALIETGQSEAGLEYLQRACQLAPDSAHAWYNCGKGLQYCAQMEPARDALQHAIALDPAHLQARNALATVLTSLGDTAAAVATHRETLRQQPDFAPAWFTLANMKIEPFSPDDVTQLQRQLSRSDLSDDARLLLGFTFAQALEDQGDHARAFDVLTDANAMKRRSIYWSRDEERCRVEAIAAAFAQPLPAPQDPTLGREVIFVVCMPRSGSTLTEQILASHPQVDGADEILDLPQLLNEESARRGQPFPAWVPAATAEDWHRLGQEYLVRTAHWRQQCPRFTDKNVDNWAFVGAALAMLPGAQVVNSCRDPLETCFALYRQLFGNQSVHYSYDLDDIVDYYAGYSQLCELWRKNHSARFFDHAYEALQADPEAQIRRLLTFCELPFDPTCLEFHQSPRTVLTISAAQVRQPLRRDTARSERYGVKLDQLRVKLRTARVISETLEQDPSERSSI